MKATLTQGAVLNGKLKAPGEQELTADEAKQAEALGIVAAKAEEPKAEKKAK